MQTYTFTIGYLVNRTVKIAINANSVEEALDEYTKGNYKMLSAYDSDCQLQSITVDECNYEEEDE